jgi:hypothetical protein
LRLCWKKERPPIDWLRLALGTLSTLSQLSAELVGRSYGGGVLKVEPGELENLLVPLVPMEKVEELAERANSLLTEGDFQRTTQVVDEALIESNSILNRANLERMKDARDMLFLRRRQHRGDAQRIINS